MSNPKGITGTGKIKLPAIRVKGSIKHYHEMLLNMSHDALDRNENELAVILASAASEICTEIAFKFLFSFKGIDYLYKNVIDPVWEYNNLTKRKNRNLYVVLSGDDISETFPSWSQFHKHYERRNGIAHRGSNVSRGDAEKSYKIVKEYIAHIEKIIEKNKPNGWGEETLKVSEKKIETSKTITQKTNGKKRNQRK